MGLMTRNIKTVNRQAIDDIGWQVGMSFWDYIFLPHYRFIN